MKNKTKKYRKKFHINYQLRSISIILLLFIFFPVGVPVMWKFAKWSKRTKWIVTGVVAALVTIGMVGSYYSEPEITVADSKYGKVSTDDPAYVLNGYLRSKRGNATLTVNDQQVKLSDNLEFSHQLSLVEGENLITLKAANENGASEEVIIIHRTTSAEFAQRAAKVAAEEAASARLEADKKAKEAKDQADFETQSRAEKAQENAEEKARQAEKAKSEAEAKSKEAAKKLAETNEKLAALEADNTCNWWCRLTGGGKTAAESNSAGSADCNWWCRLTGGDKAKSQNEVAKKESSEKLTEPTKPYKQFSSFIPKGSSHANIQNWDYTGSEKPSEAQVKNYMKDIFDEQCGAGTSWAKCDILLWDKKYNVDTSVYNDTCVDKEGYQAHLVGYIKGASGYGQFFYYCQTGNVTLSEDSRGMVVTKSVDGKAKYTTSYYIDSGYANESAY